MVRHNARHNMSHGAMRSRLGRLQVRSRRRGAAIVETGFTIVTLLLLTFWLVQYGMVYASALALNNLAREGARFAAVRALKQGDSAAGRETLRRQVEEYLLRRAQGTAVATRDLSSESVRLFIRAPKIQANAPLQVAIRYNMVRNKSFVPGLLPLPASFAMYEASAVNLIE